MTGFNRAATALPVISGVATAGVATQWARGDHVHPEVGIVVQATSATVTAAQSGVTFTNEGAAVLVTLTLPAAVAGYAYNVYVQDVDGIRVVAAAGDTIRLGASVSAAAGRIDSVDVGSFVRLISINATEWVATQIVGTWTVT